ncbi:MAG: transporter substrate-binding domain-containing protein [Oscillospiraceae bacterium]|jgi:putative lysine transport system substrate-binding protein|nr:transporter substrate-binding domain-containing protein [Oscillospiraceae bacterium]
MKRTLAVVLSLLTLAMGTIALAEPLRVGMECDYAPFNWTQAEPSDTSVPIENGGYADGYDVQIARRIADALDRDLIIVRTEWDGLPLAVMSGKIDAIVAGMSPTAERSMTIDFTQPYYESDLVVVVRADSPYAKAESLEDLGGAAITGQLNTFHYSVIDQIPGVRKQTALDTFPAMIVALNAGRVDGYVSERPGAVSAAAANPGLTFVSFADGRGFEAEPEDVAVAVGLAKDSALREPINEVLASITREERQRLMDESVARQPLSE